MGSKDKKLKTISPKTEEKDIYFILFIITIDFLFKKHTKLNKKMIKNVTFSHFLKKLIFLLS